jgi:hypothetical protein
MGNYPDIEPCVIEPYYFELCVIDQCNFKLCFLKSSVIEPYDFEPGVI